MEKRYTFGDTVVTAAFAAYLTILGAWVIQDARIDDGRGKEVAECPEQYEGTIVVTDEAAFGPLGGSAKTYRVRDGEARGGWTTDHATLPGELACEAVIAISYGASETRTVLLPAGMQALDQGNQGMVPGSSELPVGLEWATSPASK